MDRKIKPPDLSSQRVQYSMDRRGILRGKCLLEDCDCSQYEFPGDSETHLCSYCGDPPAKHLIVQTAESEKDDKEPEAQQSAQGEPVSGTSGVGYERLPPTTVQQDQSAKKKSKKSNNENEGDVSTILEESDQSDEDEAEALSRKENNFLRLYFLCNKIAIQAVQVFFDRQVPGHTLESFLKQHKSILTYHRSVFRCTKAQEAKLFPGGQVVVVSTDFDFTLLYKLIRNLLTAIPAPTCGWGMQPLPGHLNETDDIERIRYLRSSLAHNSDFEICDTDFSTHWTDLSQAIDRLSKGSLSTDVESMRTKKFDKCIINEMEEDIPKEEKKTQEKFMSECSTDIADNKQKIYDIDDRHIPLNIQNEADFLSKGGNNFIRLQLLCQKIGTQAVRIFFDSKVPGHTLESFLKQHKSNLTSSRSVYRCTKDQEFKLFPGGLVAVDSADFDFALLYKLIRNLLTAISAPTCGWGVQPLPGHLNETDDIERIRYLRSSLAHNSDLEICDTDFSTHWTDLSEAIDRLSKGSLSTDVESLRTKRFDIRSSLLSQYHYSMLNRLLGHGSYESFEMRVMVTGQFGVGKTSLVMILVGDEAPHEAQSTDGISLLEGRCGLDIENRDWILIAKDDYNARDVIYQKVLMTPDPKDKATGQYKPTKTEDATLKRHHPEQAIPKDIDTKLPTMVWPEKAEAVKIDKKSESEEMVELKPVQILEQEQMKSKMTRKEIKKQMEKALKQGDYKMKVGRLLFWDFGGQYVYYTTHQAFMTYRALFLVVFDGSTDLYDEVPDVLCFPGQHGTPTPAVFLQHWVNSILTYCKVISGEIPQILFVATHKDKIAEKDVEERRTSIYNEIDQLFKSHDGRNHLVLKHRVFVNAMNKNDPEIEILKEIITELTFNHPCWGEKMPNVWIPLELEIAELTAEGRQIMSLKEIEELNNASEVSTLSSEDLKTFLQIQHSLGKIVYFDTPQLKDYVVISPLYMVEVMKSFVTDRQFWPKDSKGKETFNKMSVHGVIEKSDLFSLWERKEFSKILLYKEYVFDMLVHLDILSEQRRYDQYTGSRLPVEDFFVPCMVTEQYTTNYMENECTPQRAICFAFVFKGSTIPPALPNRLIGACLSMWRLKTYEGKNLLFSGFIGLTIDKSHDIIVRVESNKILIFILHKTSKGLIVRDIATGVKECLYATLERISEFYQSASNKNSSQQQPFHVELACSNFKCFLPETEAKASENNHVICEGCNQNYEIEIWNQDKTTDNCHQNCTGLCEDALVQHPSDREIGRFSNQFNADMIHDIVIHLGLNVTEWENMRDNHPHNIEAVKCLILIKWRDQNTGIFRDLAEAVTAMDVTTHKLCQVRRDKRARNRGLLAEHMDYIPTDEILDALAPDIGLISFNLGIELGLRAVDLERIQHDYERNLVNQTKQVLYEWRNDTTVRATLGVLEQALVNVDKGAMCLKTVVETIGVEKRHNSRQQSIKQPSERRGGRKASECLSEEALVQHPSDREIGRFSNQCNADMIRKLVIHLRLPVNEWNDMREDHPNSIKVVKFLILIKWREQNTGISRDLAEALTAMDDTTHKLCQVRRDKRAENREHMDYIPTDEILDALAPEIGKISFNLGIELGLRAVDLERIQHDYERNLVNQTKQMLYEWRDDTTVKATLGVLEQALVNVVRGAMCLETVVETIGVEKRHNSRQQSI